MTKNTNNLTNYKIQTQNHTGIVCVRLCAFYFLHMFSLPRSRFSELPACTTFFFYPQLVHLYHHAGFSGRCSPEAVVHSAGCKRTHARTHARTNTHTHVVFYGLRGLSIGVMIFILYKLYVLLPYTYPTPKLSPHRRLCISTFP